MHTHSGRRFTEQVGWDIFAGMKGTPEKVEEFAGALVRAVEDACGLKLDFTPDTLPFLDHYRTHCCGVVGLDRPELLQLVAPMAGCYFAEVVRRSFEARWVMPSEDMATWRLELEDCFLFFNPLGLALETFLGRKVDGVPGAFEVARDMREAIAEVLDNQPGIREEDFFSLTVRWEIIDLIITHLRQDAVLRGGELVPVTEQDYLDHIEAGDDA
jgi:hypothetical protein